MTALGLLPLELAALEIATTFGRFPVRVLIHRMLPGMLPAATKRLG